MYLMHSGNCDEADSHFIEQGHCNLVLFFVYGLFPSVLFKTLRLIAR